MKPSDWLWLGICIGAFIILSGLKIEFKPFRLSAPGWMNAVGWLLLSAGVLFISTYDNVRQYGEGYKKGLKDGGDLMIKKLDEAIKKAGEEDKAKKTQAHL
jgi:hypothetical protein